jgi:hypothetical protein
MKIISGEVSLQQSPCRCVAARFFADAFSQAVTTGEFSALTWGFFRSRWGKVRDADGRSTHAHTVYVSDTRERSMLE